MAQFSEISIIYNPKSSGNSRAMAFELRQQLTDNQPKIKTTCVPTKYAGHARELACQIAQAGNRPLIISSSGDGGYNEVINGVMDAGNPKVVCAVLPAGNANDHSRAIHKRLLHEAIAEGIIKHLDLIRVTTTSTGQNTEVRYAHSYVGLGLTPAMANELAAFKLHIVKEFLQILKLFRRSHSFKINYEGTTLDLENLLFTNTYLMAKILTLAPKTLPDDGMFEVVISPSKHKLQLARRIVKAAVAKKPKPKAVQSLQEYRFSTMHDTLMQMDGEVISLEAGSAVVVESAHKVLATIF